jgi:hypothetical protein
MPADPQAASLGDGAMVGKFGTNPKHLVLDPAAMEEGLEYEFGGNVALDPGIEVAELLVVTEDGDDVEIEGFAPAMKWDPAAPPMPKEAKAAAYGVKPEKILKPSGTTGRATRSDAP